MLSVGQKRFPGSPQARRNPLEAPPANDRFTGVEGSTCERFVATKDLWAFARPAAATDRPVVVAAGMVCACAYQAPSSCSPWG